MWTSLPVYLVLPWGFSECPLSDTRTKTRIQSTNLLVYVELNKMLSIADTCTCDILLCSLVVCIQFIMGIVGYNAEKIYIILDVWILERNELSMLFRRFFEFIKIYI